MALTESVRSFHVPATPGTWAWPPSSPSVPTSRATRVTSEANPFSWSTMVLMVSLSSRISPLTSTVILRDRSPFATAVVTSAMLRTWAGQVGGHRVHVVGQVLPGAGDAGHLRLAAELALGADLARHAAHLDGEGPKLADHPVDKLRGAQVFAPERVARKLQGHRLGKVALRDRPDHAAHLDRGLGELVDQRVDGLDLPRPVADGIAHRHAHVDLSLLADLALHVLQVAVEALHAQADCVQEPRHSALQALPVGGHPHGEVALGDRCERRVQPPHEGAVFPGLGIGAGGARGFPPVFPRGDPWGGGGAHRPAHFPVLCAPMAPSLAVRVKIGG